MSDRARPANQTTKVASGTTYHTSSTRHSITRDRPGAMSPGGVGVDIKHNSYDRYLNKIKGKAPLRRGVIPPTYGLPIPFNKASPIYGGKTVKTAIINGCDCPDVTDNLDKDKLWTFLPLSIRDALPEVLQNTLYVFALQEGQLELLVRMILWEPLKNLGHRLNALSVWIKLAAMVSLLATIYIAATSVSSQVARTYLSMPVSQAMVMVSLSAFSNKHSPFQVWHAVAFSSWLAGVAVWLMAPAARPDVMLFLSGIIPSWALGILALRVLLKNDDFAANPFVFRAFAEIHPGWSLTLFVSFLGLVGFPITPAFLGEGLRLP